MQSHLIMKIFRVCVGEDGTKSNDYLHMNYV